MGAGVWTSAKKEGRLLSSGQVQRQLTFVLGNKRSDRALQISPHCWWCAQTAIAIQRHYRGYKARAGLLAQHAAATAVQAWWRGHSQRQAFLQQRAAAVAVQAAFRGWVARRQFCQLRRVRVGIQGLVRLGCAQAVASVRVKQRLWELPSHHTFLSLQGAITIQRHWRGHAVRRCIAAQQEAATTIQVGFALWCTQCFLLRQLPLVPAHHAWWLSV